VAASGTTLTEIFGVGPIVAAVLIGYTGDPTRFTTASRYAAYTGTATIDRARARSIRRIMSTIGIGATACSITVTRMRRCPSPRSSVGGRHGVRWVRCRDDRVLECRWPGRAGDAEEER
jgi:hypothetical protein